MLKGNNYYRVKRMDEPFEKLFGVNPGNRIVWKMMINGGRVNV